MLYYSDRRPWLTSILRKATAPAARRFRGKRCRPSSSWTADGQPFSSAAEFLEDRTLLTSHLDLGDAPDTGAGSGTGNYETLAVNGGPSHVIVAGLFLGDAVDGDSGTLQNVTANADDVDGALPDDEDGVLSPLDLLGTIGAAPTVTLLATNTTGSAATLAGWIDDNSDGVFDNATERAQIAVPANTTDGRFTLTFPAIPGGSAGRTYARFRLSTDAMFVANPSSTGAASDGEVEDYVFPITAQSSGTVDSFLQIASGTNGGPALADFSFAGSSVAGIGDLDGDGVADLALGAPGDDTGGFGSGAVYVLFLDANGTVRSSTKIASDTGGGPTLADADYFGNSVAGVGDLDGDGVPDLAVGAVTGDGSSGGSAAYVLFMDTDGTVKSSTKIASGINGGPTFGNYDFFGSSVAGVGDLDGDGVADLAVGARGDRTGGLNNGGAVYVLFLNSDGTVKGSTKIANGTGGGPTFADFDSFGRSVAGVGDLDGDGVPDLVVGAYGDSTGGTGRGAVHVLFMKTDGTVKSFTKIASGTGGGPALADFDSFGSSVVAAGDLDGDGVTDLAVGAYRDGTGGTYRGAVHVLLLNADGTVKSSTKIANDTGGGPIVADRDRFGSSVALLGDLNGDGLSDLAVGVSGSDTGGPQRGAVHVLFLAPADSTPPTVAVTLNDSSLIEGETAAVTFTFSGAPVGFAADDVTVENGALSAFAATGDPLVFTATFTPNAGVEDPTNVISVGTTYTDAAGNAGTAGTSANYTIDTLAPTVVITPNGTTTNNSPIVFTFQFSEAVSGFVSGDVSITNGSAGTFTPVDGDTFTLAVTPTSPGTVTVSVVAAVAQDAAGNDNVSGSASVTSSAPGEVALPGGGTYEVLINGGDLIVRIAGGAEQFRRSTATVTVLEIAGSVGADLITILNSGGTVATPILFAGKGGDDQFDASQATGPATLLGGSGNDTLAGGAGDDFIIGGSGKDVVNGGVGDDLIFGRSGRDSLVGGSGNDAIFGGSGRDSIEGGQDADTLGGGGGPDTIRGNGGDDFLRGGGGQDLIDGNDGADTLAGGGGVDNLAGGVGNDTLNGVFRDDAFDQVVGQDRLIGGNRPAGRPAPVSAPPASPEETPLLLTPQTNNDSGIPVEQLDIIFIEPLLPELLEL